MQDLISRQAAIDALDGIFDNVPMELTTEILRLRRELRGLSPADIAPVVHGEWISVPEIWGAFDIRYYCSKCGNDAIINNRERYVLSDYCPHCGAIMDNKRGNKNV